MAKAVTSNAKTVKLVQSEATGAAVVEHSLLGICEYSSIKNKAMASVNLRTVFAFAREMHSKHPSMGDIQYGE